MPAQGQMQGPDSVGGSPGTVGAGELESSIGAAGMGDIDMRNDRTDLEALGEQLEADHDIATGREIDQDRVDDMIEQHAATTEAAAERHAAAEAKLAEMAEAHANGDNFFWGTDTYDGQTVDVWISPDGHTYFAEPGTGNIIGVEWADGATPEYMGEYITDGEAYAMYELPNGTQILVDDDGQMVGYVDDFPPDTFWHEGLGMEVYAIPQGADGGYDTTIYSAETGEPIMVWGTGDYTVHVEPGDGAEIYSTYAPWGADFYLVIDEGGNVIEQIDFPPEKEWGILGIVEYYDDGTVAIDIGVASTEIDVIGPEGGITITIDALGTVAPLTKLIPGFNDMGEFGVTMEWDEEGTRLFGTVGLGMLGSADFGIDTNFDLIALMDGDVKLGNVSWNTFVDADLNLSSVGDVSVFVELGRNEDGDYYVEGLTHVDANVGALRIEGGQNLYMEVGNDHFELEVGLEGTVSVLGFYVERDTQFAVDIEDGAATFSYSDMIGVGHKALGGLQITTDNQITTDGTRDGTTLTTGVRVGVVDSDGDEVAGAGGYLQTDGEEGNRAFQSDELLDNKVTHDKFSSQSGDNSPDQEAPDGSADFEIDLPDEDDANVDRPTRSPGRPGRDVFDALDPANASGGASGTRSTDKNMERNQNLDEVRNPTGEPARPTQTTQRDLGLDEVRDPIGPARDGDLHDNITESGPALPWKGVAGEATPITPVSRTVAPRSGDQPEIDTAAKGDGVLTDMRPEQADRDTTTERDLGLDEVRDPIGQARDGDLHDDITESGTATPLKWTAREVAPITPVSRTVAPRSGDQPELDGVAEGEGVWTDMRPAQNDRDTTTERDLGLDEIRDPIGQARDGDLHDDIAAMPADSGTDGLDVGRAPVQIDNTSRSRTVEPLGEFELQTVEPDEPYEAVGDFAVESTEPIEIEIESVAIEPHEPPAEDISMDVDADLDLADDGLDDGLDV